MCYSDGDSKSLDAMLSISTRHMQRHWQRYGIPALSSLLLRLFIVVTVTREPLHHRRSSLVIFSRFATAAWIRAINTLPTWPSTHGTTGTYLHVLTWQALRPPKHTHTHAHQRGKQLQQEQKWHVSIVDGTGLGRRRC